MSILKEANILEATKKTRHFNKQKKVAILATFLNLINN